jgi:magnesium-transporting ATPase (P-type)
MIYSFAFRIHIIISTITLLAGILTLVMSGHGLSSKREYGRKDQVVSLVFNVALYFQLILGFLIYYVLRSTREGSLWEVPDTQNDASLRFWAIEHIALMIFALFLTQLGRIYIKRSKGASRKFRASMFYFGTSLLLILFSMGMAMFGR